MGFWQRVKNEIKIQNTTQEWLSAEIGVSLGTFRNWIYHDRIPNAVYAEKIANALESSVRFFVTGKNQIISPIKNPDYKELCDVLSELSEKQLAEIKGVVNTYIKDHFQERDSRKQNLA